jgi:putative Ca2+/H+ antiporter (TMEM165/GDT1 family)
MWKRFGKAVIFGGSLSTLTMCAILSAVMGAQLHLAAFLGSAIIALFTGALFVGYADYMNQTHERDLIRWERKRETW